MDAHQTPRQKIQELLMAGPHSLRDLSQSLRLAEKDILAELPHVEKSLKPLHFLLARQPAACRRCSYVFRNRSRFSKPGKCPACRSTAIEPPSFYIDTGRTVP